MHYSVEMHFLLIMVSLSFFIAWNFAVLASPLTVVSSSEGDNSTTNQDLLSSGNTSSSEGSEIPGKLQVRYTGIIRSDINPEVARALGLNETFPGLIITEVIPDSPAENAGLRGANQVRTIEGERVRLGGDIIVSVDGNRSAVKDREAFVDYLRNKKMFGENITLSILRDGRMQEKNLTITPLPDYFWYVNQDEGIRIQYPSDWEPSTSNLGRGDIIRFFSPEIDPNTDEPVATVLLRVLPGQGITLEEQAVREREGSPNTRTLDVRGTELSSEQAYETIFYDYAGNTTQKVKSVFTLRDDQIYTINFISNPSGYDDYLPMVEEMIKSFRFERGTED